MSTKLTLPAGEDLTGWVGKGVVISSNTWIKATVLGTATGILESDGESGDWVTACTRGRTQVVLGEAVTAYMDQLMVAADGAIDLADATNDIEQMDALQLGSAGDTIEVDFQGVPKGTVA